MERMEIGRRIQCADSVESQHRIEFVQLQSRCMRKRKRSMQRTAPAVLVRRRLQNWRSSSRQQRTKTNVWLQEHNKWTSLRNWTMYLVLSMMEVEQLIWTSCKLLWISATSIFLSRCTMLHCVRNLILSSRKNKMPSQSRLRSPTCQDGWRRSEKRNKHWINKSPICASNSNARKPAWRCWQWTSMNFRKAAGAAASCNALWSGDNHVWGTCL